MEQNQQQNSIKIWLTERRGQRLLLLREKWNPQELWKKLQTRCARVPLLCNLDTSRWAFKEKPSMNFNTILILSDPELHRCRKELNNNLPTANRFDQSIAQFDKEMIDVVSISKLISHATYLKQKLMSFSFFLLHWAAWFCIHGNPCSSYRNIHISSFSLSFNKSLLACKRESRK